MANMRVSNSISQLLTILFPPARRLAGPFHRRRPTFAQDPNRNLPPLPDPWRDERWFRGDFPPRAHNSVEVLHDGEEYFRDLYAALLSAKQRVTICGWSVTPRIPLLRGEDTASSVLADVLAEVSRRAEVFVLIWSGSPVLFVPTERTTEQARQKLLERAPSVKVALDDRAPFSHDHHQKAVTIDDRIAFVGGMDLTTDQGDRWDSNDHPLRFGTNWHDVQLGIRGEAVQDVEANFCQRWNAVTGERLEPLPPRRPHARWETPLQIVRTIPAGIYPFAPKGHHGIYHSLIAAIRRAERFIYLENQYIWAPEIIQALVYAMNRRRQHPFRVLLVLPARATEGRYDNDQHVELLRNEDAGRHLFHVYSLYTGGPAPGTTAFGFRPIYVHAKVSIVDDEWFSVGSANLNRRGLASDTELNVQGISPGVARTLRLRLWSQHLGVPERQIAKADPAALIDGEWKSAADAMEAAIQNGTLPPTSKVRTYQPGRTPGSRFLDLLQTATLEH
jgi:phosphatidylserine/phosphatidylglycerophosphate/cardiolipin synthase-like enzyme